MIRAYKNILHRVSHSPHNSPTLLLHTVVFTVLSFIISPIQNKEVHKIIWGHKEEKAKYQNLPLLGISRYHPSVSTTLLYS